MMYEKSRTPTESLDTAALALRLRRNRAFALAGIFSSMFVSMFSATVVGTSMPVIMGDLGGTQGQLTWVVTATMLATAVSAPIWGKFADLTNKKHLLQLALGIFTLGSALAGLAQSPEWLIGWRFLQGVGGGGLAALGQIIMADIISPRERGRYMGIGSAVMAVATIGGPLIGGLITDTIGWRWNFFVAVPIAIATLIMLQLTLRLTVHRRSARIDLGGAVLITVGFSALLLWISLGGTMFAWWSTTSVLLIGGAILTLAVLVLVERHVREPMIPLTLFRNRTFTLASIASTSVGISMFSVAVFLGQYMQLARGHTPLESGLLTIPMMLGTLSASTGAGQYVTKTGRWKRVVVGGSTMTLVGVALMTFIRHDTPYGILAIAMFLLGIGVGMSMQNLVLAVQNTVDPADVGAASANVTFFRTIGGTTGLALMGAVISSEVVTLLREGFRAFGDSATSMIAEFANDTIPVLTDLPEPVRDVFEESYGLAIASSFTVAIPFAVIALVATIFLPNIPLGTKTTSELLAERRQRGEIR